MLSLIPLAIQHTHNVHHDNMLCQEKNLSNMLDNVGVAARAAPSPLLRRCYKIPEILACHCQTHLLGSCHDQDKKEVS
jgi:hypothetical protein